MWYDKLYHHASYDRVHNSRTGRFGFDFLENLRKNFCQSQFCMSADSMPYFINLMCAIKCPDLYLPHHPTESNSKYNINIYFNINSKFFNNQNNRYKKMYVAVLKTNIYSQIYPLFIITYLLKIQEIYKI